MKLIGLVAFSFFLGATIANGDMKLPIETEVIESVHFDDVELEVALEEMRAKGTAILRKVNDDSNFTLGFVYQFDPLKERPRITLSLKDTTFLTALTAISTQAGILWGHDKNGISFVDKRAAKPRDQTATNKPASSSPIPSRVD